MSRGRSVSVFPFQRDVGAAALVEALVLVFDVPANVAGGFAHVNTARTMTMNHLSKRPTRLSTQRQSRRLLWRRFFEDFTEHLRRLELDGVVPKLLRHRHLQIWRDDRYLHRVYLQSWSEPDKVSRTRPSITRIAMECMRYAPPVAVLESDNFGASGGPRPYPVMLEKLEFQWTVHDDELVEMARWLPKWICGRLQPSLPIPLPPVPCYVCFGEGLRTTVYAWTVAASDAWTTFDQGEPTVPSNAIPPDELKAEPGQPPAEPNWWS